MKALVVPAGITSVPLQMLMTVPLFTVIVHPTGNSVCSAFTAVEHIAMGTVMFALTLLGCIGLTPVLATLTLKSTIAPWVTTPALAVTMFKLALVGSCV
jgi:hypothetical protein